MNNEKWRDLVENHHLDLMQKYPLLTEIEFDEQCFSAKISGSCEFTANYKNNTAAGKFDVCIAISRNYPNEPPKAYSLNESIPLGFHTYSDGSFCLGAPLAIQLNFNSHPTLIGFTDFLLVPYLFSYLIYERDGIFPYGDLAHGVPGILTYYMEYFGVSDPQLVLPYLIILSEGRYKGHIPCVCGSGLISRRCHGSLLLQAAKARPSLDYFDELLQLLVLLENTHKGTIVQFMTPSLRKLHNRIIRQSKRHKIKKQKPTKQ